MLLLKAEGAGHAAAAGVEHFVLEAKALEDFFFAIHSDDCFLVAMTVNDSVPLELLRGIIRRVFSDEFAQGEGLLAQALCVLIVGQEIGKFLTENCAAAWLEHHHWNAF